ncbi:hypothetical protein [Prevotella sp. HUN102]|nr:hypothetical protein [Prevotella sp. HUN102]
MDKILDTLGIELTPMQEASSEAILHSDKDVVVLSRLHQQQ